MRAKKRPSLFHNSRQAEEEQPLSASLVSEQTKIPTEKDVIELAYEVVQRRIDERLCEDYPDARWVWESNHTKDRIKDGLEVFILLNQAGGYRRAKVVIKNLQLLSLIFETHENKQKTPEDILEEGEDAPEELTDDYGLLAFEWVEAHVQELNEKCNNAIGLGIEDLILSSEELPVKESWDDICQELKRAGVNKVSCIPEGIKISLRQE